MPKQKLRRQKPVKGGRIPAHTGLITEIELAIRREMARFGVSRSFVIATACAFAFGIDEQEDYRPRSPRLSRPHLTLVNRKVG